jgi:hypothetical protein
LLRLHPSAIDYTILAIYFVVVLGIGFVARLFIKTDLDVFLSGCSVPEYQRLRFNEATHAFNAGTFAVATELISGVKPPECGQGSGRIRRAPAT